MTNFKAVGYELFRKSEKTFSHAVIFKNISESNPGIGASFHISKDLAEKNAKRMNGYNHLEIVEIVEVVAIND